MSEIWRSVPGFEGLYEVSDLGRVRNARTLKVLRQRADSDGYLLVDLFKGARHTVKVHRAVALAFHGDPPEGMPTVDHCNGIRRDNRAVNLRWATVRGNNLNRKNAAGVRLIPSGKYVAYMGVRGRYVHLGTFNTFDEARRCRETQLRRALNKETKCHTPH